jgi:hypothetical protein
VYLYGALLATLVPVVQNLLALLARTLAIALGLEPYQAMLGGNQSLSDNLIAMALNGLFAAYIYSVLRADWKEDLRGDAFPEVRRLYRYIWMIYGLAMLVFGIQQILAFVITIWDGGHRHPHLLQRPGAPPGGCAVVGLRLAAHSGLAV